jgi:DNA-binding transcriptional MerR regulator
MSMDGRLSIGGLAKAAGVKVVTVRYYEKVNLMPEPSRTEGNYRAYKREHLARLRFIRRCRDLGFTLDQVREIMQLSVQAERDCSGIDQLTAKHLADIERKIADLKSLQPSCAGSIAGVRGTELLPTAAFSKRCQPARSAFNAEEPREIEPTRALSHSSVGIPVKLNTDSEGKPNGVPG